MYVEYVADPRQMPRMPEIALRTAIEQRGVAVLVIPSGHGDELFDLARTNLRQLF